MNRNARQCRCHPMNNLYVFCPFWTASSASFGPTSCCCSGCACGPSSWSGCWCWWISGAAPPRPRTNICRIIIAVVVVRMVNHFVYASVCFLSLSAHARTSLCIQCMYCISQRGSISVLANGSKALAASKGEIEKSGQRDEVQFPDDPGFATTSCSVLLVYTYLLTCTDLLLSV